MWLLVAIKRYQQKEWEFQCDEGLAIWLLKNFYYLQTLSCNDAFYDWSMKRYWGRGLIGTKKPPRSDKAVFLEIRRKCFLVSTAEDLNSSLNNSISKKCHSRGSGDKFPNCHMCQLFKRIKNILLTGASGWSFNTELRVRSFSFCITFLTQLIAR